MKDIIEDARRDKVREEELRGLNGGGGGTRRQNTPAYPANQDTTATNTTTPTPNSGSGNRQQ